ncbi:MAG: formate--tetrahydrofolate ligase, partial [Lactobacillus gasseri]|nr:formate--tetrahydrofolate ligase [Lactobacillus gasseri]
TDHLDEENIPALEKGFANLKRHMENMAHYGVPVIVLINKFASDTDQELNKLKELVQDDGFECEIVSYHDEGSKGGIQAAEKVVELTGKASDFKPVYKPEDSVEDKIAKIAHKIYHAKDIEYSDTAKKQLAEIKKMGKDELPVIIAKTQYSFTDKKKILGAPEDFILHVKDLALKNGAGFIVVATGSILDMPGLPKHPAALDIDVDNNGKISGLF